MATPLVVLTGNRDFRRLFIAELVVFGGDWFALIPLVTLLQQNTGSGLPGALALVADSAVNALMLPYAGTVADRYDRRRIMIVSNVAMVVSIALLFAVSVDRLWWLGPVGIGLAAAGKAFYSLAASAALPNLVGPRDLRAANALGGSAWGTMLVVGAALGGLVSAAFGPYVCFGITVVCLMLSSALVWSIRQPMQEPRDPSVEPASPLAAIIEALRYIRRHPRVLSLVTVKSAVGFGNGSLAVFPVLAVVVFATGPLGTGLLFAARGLGAVLGPLLLTRVLARRSWLMPGLAISMTVYGLSYLGVAVSPWYGLVLAFVALAHFAGGGNWAMSNFALQMEVPDPLRGRVFATDLMIVTLAMSVSTLFAGVLADYTNPRVPIAVCASLTLLYGLTWRLVTRRLMKPVKEAVDD